ncbi:MAG TPA: hypothetical protein VK158_01095 [Acidobacteriota bacterium]|nr:hypothetical protein [Acidobacteriota bacterium]
MRSNTTSYASFGYDDPTLVDAPKTTFTVQRAIAVFFALLFITAVWLALDQKLLFGKSWISETYDNPDWKTNEGNLRTYGAWDIEAHIWKTEYIQENFPHFQWNPYWYLGMPLIKYYQAGFYFMNILLLNILGVNAARAALLLVIFGHLLATFLTFLVCYKVSRRIWVAALSSIFLLSNTFISLRSYGWEPITVVFLFLYPLGLYLFLKEPLRPFRFWLILVLGISYISHPLLWFSLCMFMGLYLFSIAMRKDIDTHAQTTHYIWQYVGIVFLSLFIGAFQFLPQFAYEQVSSGAHMGIHYLPFYQVPPNIISPLSFFFDAGNLKGPGPIIMIAFALLLVFAYIQYWSKSAAMHPRLRTRIIDGHEHVPKKLHTHQMIAGLTLVLFVMVLFYYMERYNIFPMNMLRSIQYHRIIPEFVITASILVAALSNLAYTRRQQAVYYSLLIGFVIASGIIIYSVQAKWQTTDVISDRPEFINDPILGRISMPYTDQSFSVRNSFTLQHQVYGYYEQGITNPYVDEIFSVSSGYHNSNLTVLYLKAANVERLYINKEEGERDTIVMSRLNGTVPYFETDNPRYGYFKIDIKNPDLVQVVDSARAMEVQMLQPPCRVMFQQEYCGSVGEEFVSTDAIESKYILAYVDMLESAPSPSLSNTVAQISMENPDNYVITVANATANTAIVVKMTHDPGFTASMDGQKVPIKSIGPDFMLITPQKTGDLRIDLRYSIGPLVLAGAAISGLSVVALALYFGTAMLVRRARAQPYARPYHIPFGQGDMK